MRDRPVVVMAAMPRELRPLARVCRLRSGSVCGRPSWRADGVLAVAVGVGPVRAGDAATQVLEEVVASRVLVTGVAGAVDPSLGVGDLVLPAAVVDVRSGRRFIPSAPGSRAGVLATVERLPGDDGWPALPDDVTALDMETAAIAAAAGKWGVPWDVIRAVSDTPGTLTDEIAALLRPDGRADLRRATALVLHEPRIAGRLVRLGIGTSRAIRVATRAVVEELEAEGLRRKDAWPRH